MNVTQNKKSNLSPSVYFRLMDFCTVTFALGLAVNLMVSGNPVYVSPFGVIFFLTLIYLVWRGPADEFAASCWDIAASVAFITMVGLAVIIPFVLGFSEGMFEAFTDGHVGAPPAGAAVEPVNFIDLQFNDALTVSVSIAAFLITFQWRRWRAAR